MSVERSKDFMTHVTFLIQLHVLGFFVLLHITVIYDKKKEGTLLLSMEQLYKQIRNQSNVNLLFKFLPFTSLLRADP